MKTDILSHLSPEYPWKDLIQYFPSLGSTNDLLKTLARQGAPHGTAILAGHQTGGHGRLGRSFHSPEGMGVYLSFLIRPDCAPTALMHLTCATAVAMCEAVEAACGLRPGIKWTNDLVYGRRKLGGILTELGLSSQGTADYAIIGIGINCCQQEADFPEDIRNIAASLSMVTGKEIDRSRIAAALTDAFYAMDQELLTQVDAMLEQYRSRCITLGQEISLVRADVQPRHGRALSVDETGALVVEFVDGSVEAVSSGEVSVRGMYGYV